MGGEALHAAGISSSAGNENELNMARRTLQDAGLLDYDPHGRQVQPEPEPDIDHVEVNCSPTKRSPGSRRSGAHKASEWQHLRPQHTRIGVTPLELDTHCSSPQALPSSASSTINGGLRQVQAARVELKRVNSVARQKRALLASTTPSGHQLSLRRRPHG